MIIGAPVLQEDALAVIKQANYAYGYTPQLHVSQVVGPTGWQVAGSPMTHNIEFRAATSSVEVFRFAIKVQPEVVTLTCGARCFFASSESGVVKFRFYDGATDKGSVSVAIADTDNGGEVTGTIATSTIGTGWLQCRIEIAADGAASAGNDLITIRVQDTPITSSLPAPIMEGNDCDDIEVT